MSEAPERIWAWWDDAYDVGLLNEHGDKRYTPDDAKEYVRADRIEELETLIKDLFILLDKTEETDDGRVFHPNHISSSRAEDGQKLENLLRLLKATVEGRW